VTSAPAHRVVMARREGGKSSPRERAFLGTGDTPYTW
jgi:hypothetical protein